MSHEVSSFGICPNCGQKLDCTTSTDFDDSIAPSEGDFTFCFYCTSLLVFTQALSVRLPSDSELKKARKMPEIQKTSALLKRFRQEGR